MPNYPTTVGSAIEHGAQLFTEANLFFGHGTDNAEDEALWLTFHALSLSFDESTAVFEKAITPAQWLSIQQLFMRRIDERVPAAYLTGKAWFCGYPFWGNKDVLVPRSPIGELIEQQFRPWLKKPPESVLDLCTGCGCIGIATALYCPDARVDLSDISEPAVQIAQKNIHHHALSNRVTTIHSDLFSHLQDKQYDLIVSNPPYVDASDLAAMPEEFQAEPGIALGSGEDGLDVNRSLLREAANYLTEGGVIIVEVGNSWEHLEEAFPEVPFLWLEFAHGGHGVFMMTRDELLQYQPQFSST